MKIQFFMIIVCLIFVASSAAVSMAKLTEGLLAYWSLDGDVKDGIADHDGKLEGGSEFVTDAKRGKVLKVDGVDGHAVVPHADDIIFANTDSYTLSVWVNVLQAPGHWAGIVNKSRDQSPWYGLWINPSNQWVAGGSNITGSAIETNVWIHLALVQDADANKRIVYVNGDVDVEGSAIDSTGGGDLWMGGAKSVNEYLNGLIDDVLLYNRVLTPGDIKELASGVSIIAVKPAYRLTTTWGAIKQ